MTDLLKKVFEGEPLDREEAHRAMGLVMDGQVTPAQLAGLLVALKLRGERLDEIVGFAQALRQRATPVKVKRSPLLDTCGTGGDGAGTFNVSTTVAFIAAGAGAAVAKHGNRAVSSKSGSADVLEALGVKTDLSAEQAARCVEEAGIGFLFAPVLHPAMKQAAPVRKELGVRTVFNVLGPLVNPAGAKRQLLGVYSPRLVPLLAHALGELGSEEAIVVSSRDGLDELSLRAPAAVAHLKDGRVEEYELDAAAFGFAKREASAYAGGDAQTNARILLSVLRGDEGGPLDLSLWNAAAALIAAGLAADMREGLERSREAVRSGKAMAALEALTRLSRA